METFFNYIDEVNAVLWHEYVLYVILGTAILFTLWSVFSQYYALTHGVSIIRGKYDHKEDPGAITHFQALSAALSATVGLGNIGGVAIAISLGGPGAIFWMWIVGFAGMALKTGEVILSMLYRNTDDPENPQGGPMWVADRGFTEISPKLKRVGKIVAGVFCITLIISTFTGGNMFQAFNVGDVTHLNFGVPPLVSGVILCILVALVIIGGIKRIGAVAGRVVPFMCVIYILAASYVLIINWESIPGLFALIFRSAFNPLEAQGAFIGGTAGYAFILGMKRALFSNEVGQGSAPIAHSAAKTDEPVREGVVAGLEPFIDTLVVCTMTALVVLSSGVWNRSPEVTFPKAEIVQREDAWTLETPPLPPKPSNSWKEEESVFMILLGEEKSDSGANHHKLSGKVEKQGNQFIVKWDEYSGKVKPRLESLGVYKDYVGASLTSHAFDLIQPGIGKWLVTLAVWLFAFSTMISWSYYGEQGVLYLMGQRAVLPYKFIFCALIVLSCTGFITTTKELDALTGIGTGVMLFANIPICLIFAHKAMKAYHGYIRKLRAGQFN